jgi:hypothetical protein
MRRLLMLFFLLIFLPFVAKSQSGDIDFSVKITQLDTLYKWGVVPEADLKMTQYPLDTAAEAVVLFDIGYIQVSGDWLYGNLSIFNRHKRVKILKKSAFNEEGNVRIPISTSFYSDALSDLKAQVIQPDGTVKQLTNDNFFFEKLSNTRSVKKIAFPDLREGSIIEYSYQITSSRNLMTLRDWYFQENIPIRRSELYMGFESNFGYQYVAEGAKLKNDGMAKNECVQLNNFILKGPVPRFYMDSVPAMREESFITTMDDYRGRVRFQLNSYTSQSGHTREFFNTWDVIAKQLTLDPNFGEQIEKKRNYNAIWKAVKQGMTDTMSVENKIKHIYTYLSKNLEWKNDDFSFLVDETLEGAFKKKQANSGEMNLMLIACLREADIKANPMLISTRDNGKAVEIYPIMTQFNHVLCYTELEGKPLILDVGNPNRPIGTPRVPSLNKRGLLIDGEKGKWVGIRAPSSSETMLANFTLSPDGTYVGNMVSSYQGYAAVNERDLERETDKEKKIKENLLKEFPEIQIDSIVAMNTDLVYEPFKRNIYCKIPNAAMVNDDFIYIKPTINNDFSNNPFKAETRNYPIELPYPIKDNYVVNITIPEGYVVEEMPKAVNINLLNKGNFYYENSIKDNLLQISMRINISHLRFEAEDYDKVKAFFKAIAVKYNEQIVLKKGGEKKLEERK